MLQETLTEIIPREQRSVITDILGQAITGELIGMSNFASLAESIDDIHEKLECVEHANCERGHAEGFMSIAKQFNLKPGKYEGLLLECRSRMFFEVCKGKRFYRLSCYTRK